MIEVDIKLRLHRLERDIIVDKRLRKQRVQNNEPTDDLDQHLTELKRQAKDIRAMITKGETQCA